MYHFTCRSQMNIKIDQCYFYDAVLACDTKKSSFLQTQEPRVVLSSFNIETSLSYVTVLGNLLL